MNRRRLLVGAGALAGPLLAGCLGDGGSSGTETPTSTGSRSSTATPAPTATSTRTTAGTPTSEGTETLTTGMGSESPSPPATETTEATEATEPAGSTTETGTGTETRTTSSTRSSAPSGTPDRGAIVDRGIEVSERACGTADEGEIAVEGERIVVTGTITGSDGCATAVLDETAYDREANRLRIVVGTRAERDGGTVCAQCLTAIEYEATVRVEGSSPERVVLVHRGATGERRVETATT